MENIKLEVRKSVHNCTKNANHAYLTGDENPSDIYNEEILKLEQISEYISETIEHLNFLKNHTCEYEDDYCIHCGRDGLA